MALDRTREILNQLSSKGKEALPPKVDRKLLIVLTGTDNDMEELITPLVRARGRGLRYRLALSRAAEGLFNIDSIALKLQPMALIKEGASIDEAEVLRDIAAVVVPLLTQNTAFKLCNGIQDQLIPRLLWQSLWLGRPIWMNLEGLRTYRGLEPAAEAIKNMVETNIQRLRALGIKEIKDKNYMAELLQCVEAGDLAGAAEEEAISPLTANLAVTGKTALSSGIKKSIITEGDILKISPQVREIKIGANSIITPLAYDTARRRGINIIKA